MNPSDTQPQSASMLDIIGNLPGHWPVQTDLLQWCQVMGPAAATLLVMGGIVYLMFGIHIYRYLVMLNAALVGAALGAKLGERGE